MSEATVLVVDDEQQIRTAVARALTTRGYRVELATDGLDAIAEFERTGPDLVILDLNLPELDGLGVCRRIRSWSQVPILILSVRDEESDRVEALDLGADDYLTKPFGTDELLARVRALLRRAAGSGAPAPRRYAAGAVTIDLEKHRIVREGEPVHLTKTEWGLLDALCHHPGKLLTHRWLLENVWGPGYTEDLDVLRVFVSQLRKKIEPDPKRPRLILTDPGVGYRWGLEPEPKAS